MAKNNPTLARDMMFAVIMIALNGLIGLSLLLGGLRHGEQYYNLQGVSAYLNTIMALSCARLGSAKFHYFHVGPEIFDRSRKSFLPLPRSSLRNFSSNSDDAAQRVFHGHQSARRGGTLQCMTPGRCTRSVIML